MQLKSRGVLVALVVLAMSALAVSAASAATLPEFKPVPTKKKLTASSGEMIWHFSGNEIKCAKSSATGEVTGARTVGGLVVKFTECTTVGATKSGCEINSAGAKKGEILTKALKGELGTVKTAEAASGVGLLVKPEEGKKWTTLAGNECTSETTLTGTVAAEVPTIGKKQATNKLAIDRSGGVEAIKKITLDSGLLEEPELVCWSATITLEGTDELKFEEALEVT